MRPARRYLIWHDATASPRTRSSGGRQSSAGMEVSDAKKLRALEQENQKLKRLLAEAELDKAATQGAGLGKMVTATQRRRAVTHLKSRRVSERRACRLVRFSRSAAWYRLQGRHDSPLRDHLKELAQEYPRYGCPTLHDLLVTEGRVVKIKRTYRRYREEGCRCGASDASGSTSRGSRCWCRAQSTSAGQWTSYPISSRAAAKACRCSATRV